MKIFNKIRYLKKISKVFLSTQSKSLPSLIKDLTKWSAINPAVPQNKYFVYKLDFKGMYFLRISKKKK